MTAIAKVKVKKGSQHRFRSREWQRTGGEANEKAAKEKIRQRKGCVNYTNLILRQRLVVPTGRSKSIRTFELVVITLGVVLDGFTLGNPFRGGCVNYNRVRTSS
jgi:hypothetical protein